MTNDQYPGLAHAQPFPGATTCVLLGRVGPEPVDLHAFRAVLWIVDAAGRSPAPQLAAGARCEIIDAASAPASLSGLLEKFLRLDARHLPTVFVTTEAAQDPAGRYPALLAEISPVLESHHRARVTRQKDAFTWQKHLLQNLPAYLRHPLPARWEDALAGVPAFVCAAGPSLDVSAPHLAAVVDRGVIFAADSALNTLARHGVTADFVVSVDLAKLPEKCLPLGRTPAHAVLAPVSPPAWTAALPAARTSFVSSRQLTADWLARAGLGAPALAVAENCGVTALELARFLGCTPIHLFGLDLALTATQRHTTGAEASIYAQSGFDAAQSYPEVPGNYAPTVRTHAIGDWRALDRRLGAWPAGLVVNVNDRGARLANTTLVAPDRFTLVAAPFDRTRLDGLPEAAAPGDAALASALAPLHTAGRRGQSEIPALRHTLATQGPVAVAAALRPWFADETTAHTLGGFSLKVMPHLLPPVEGDIAFWNQLLDEAEELFALAQRV
jgi:hypothetical protein